MDPVVKTEYKEVGFYKLYFIKYRNEPVVKSFWEINLFSIRISRIYHIPYRLFHL